MAAIRETLYKFDASVNDLINGLRKVEKAAADLPEEEIITVRAEVTKAIADMEAAKKQARDLEKQSPEITATFNMRQYLGDLDKAQRALRKMPGESDMTLRVAKIDIRENEVKAAIAKVRAEIEQLQKQQPELIVNAKIEQAMARLGQLDQRLEQLQNKQTTPKVEADTAKAEADIALLIERITELERLDPRVKVDAAIAGAEAKLAKLQAELVLLGKTKTEIKVDVDRNARANLSSAIGSVSNLGRQVKKAQTALEATDGAAKVFGNAISLVTSHLRRLGPIMTGAAIVIVTALIPALLGIGLAAAGAVGGLGALAAAFGGALMPAVLGLVGVLSRFSAVMKTLQAQEKAEEEAANNAADAEQRAAQAAQTLLQARRGLADASRGVERAEVALQGARKTAREDIVSKERAYTNAVDDSRDAAENLERATVDAYRSIRDAIEDASDAALAFERAQLSADEAKLGVDQATFALEEFKKEAGAGGTAVEDLFKKFTDVDVDTGGLAKAVEKATGAVGAGGLDKGQQLELRQLILDVRDAKLREKEATDGVSDSEQDLNDKTREANRLRKTGIGGVDGYKDALKRLSDSQETLVDTQKDYNEALKDGVKGSPGVVAAQQALSDAQRDLNRQQQDFAGTQKQVQDSLKGTHTAIDDFAEAWKKLAPVEQQALLAWKGIKDDLKGLATAMSGPVIGAILGLRDNFSAAVPLIKAKSVELGNVWANTIKQFGQDFHVDMNPFKDLKGFQNLSKLGAIFQGTINIAKSLGDVFRNSFGILLNLAVAAMPHLEKLVEDFGKWLGTLRSASDDTGSLSEKIAPMIETLRNLGSIGAGAIGGIVNSFLAGEGPINDFLKWIGDALKGFSDWAKSAEGKNMIKSFFEDTLPAAKSIIKFIVRIGKVFLMLFKIAMPVLKPIVDMFNSILDVIVFLLKVLDTLLGPFKTLLGIAISMIVPFGKVGQAIGLFIKNIGKIVPFIGKALGPLKVLAREVGGKFKAAWDKAVQIFQAVWPRLKQIVVRGVNGVVSIARKVLGKLEGPFKWIVGQVTKRFNVLWGRIKWVWDKIKTSLGDAWAFIKSKSKPILTALKGLASGIEDAFQGAIDIVENLFDGLVGVIKGAVNLMISGINKLIGAINSIPSIKVPGLGKVGIPDIPEVPKLAQGGIVSSATAFVAGDAGKEAILPLTRKVFADLARGITAQMGPLVRRTGPLTATAGTGGGAPSAHYDQKIYIHSPPATYPDARVTASLLAKEMRRRGGVR